MIEDTIKSIKATLYERATSPLLGAYVMSWVICNYKLLVVLMSSMTVLEKFRFIDEVLYVDTSQIALKMALYPVIGAGFLIFVYPFPARFVYSFWRGQQKALKGIKQKIEDETPLTIEESRALRKQIDSLANQYEVVIGRKEREIEDLSDKIKRLEESLNQREKTISDMQSTSLDKSSDRYSEKLSILDLLSDVPKMETNEIISKTGLDKKLALYLLGELSQIGLIRGSNVNGQSGYEIDQKGRRVLVEDGKI